MKNNIFGKTTLHMAMALTLSSLNTGPVSAMGFFDTEDQDSVNLKIESSNGAPTTDRSAELLTAAEPEIIELPDRINRIFAQPNDANDKVYYSFTSTRGQKVMIYNMRTMAEGPDWNVEYKIDGEWIQVPPDHSFISSELVPNQKVFMRVSRSAGKRVVTGDRSAIEFGSAPYVDSEKTEVSGDYQWFLTYFPAHLFKHQLSWRSRITDSKGHPIAGAVVHFIISADEDKPHKLVTKEYITDASGFIIDSMKFDECIGKNKTPPFVLDPKYKTEWKATYNTGYWQLAVRGNSPSDITPSTLTQLCSATPIR